MSDRFCNVRVLEDPSTLGNFKDRVIPIEANLLNRLIQEEIWSQTGWPPDEIPVAQQLRLIKAL